MTLTKYLNPKYDITFKKIFGTEKNKELLINFLNEALKNQIDSAIVEVIFLPTIQDPEIASKKQSIVDVLCKDSTNVQYIIEMQMTEGTGFEERAQYYAAKAYVAQMQSGNKLYSELKKVIFIALANYNVFPEKEDYKSEHVILDAKTLENDLKMFSFTFVNLPKFKQLKKKLKDLTLEEKWYYFLASAQDTVDADLAELVGEDEIIKQAFAALEMFSWSEEDLAAYNSEEKRRLDETAIEHKMKLDARTEGKAEGLAEGKALGKAEGRALGELNKAIEIAKNLLEKGFDSQDIAKITGLSEDEIKKLALLQK